MIGEWLLVVPRDDLLVHTLRIWTLYFCFTLLSVGSCPDCYAFLCMITWFGTGKGDPEWLAYIGVFKGTRELH